MRTFFIATKHAEYAEREFPPGSVVIDPWRYIPDQPGVTVKRIGQNRPALISLLVPTRGRHRELVRMLDSAFCMATHERQLELVTYIDNDDPSFWAYPEGLANDWWYKRIEGPRILLSEMWNECYRHANGDILMHCGDDIVFRTPGWDVMVREAFDQCEDKILLVHGDDLSPNTHSIATHGFVHRRWVETLGYFVPPLFSSDWNDVWLTEVADALGRRVQLPFVTEHLHYIFGKSEYDETYREREERGVRDGVNELYVRTADRRQEDAAKLRAVMA